MSLERGAIKLADFPEMSAGYGNTQSSEETSYSSLEFFQVEKLMKKVRKFVREKGIMVEDQFHEYDPLRTGNVSASDFKKAFKEAFQDLLADEQVEEILNFYRDHDNSDVCNWSKFLHDAETAEISALHQDTLTDSHQEAVLKRVALLMKDKMNISTLLPSSPSQLPNSNGVNEFDTKAEEFFQLLSTLTSKEDLKIVMNMYTDEMGFKYQELLRDLQEVEHYHEETERFSKRSESSNQSPRVLIEIPDDQVVDFKQTKPFVRQRWKRFSISYEALVWSVFLMMTTLCIVDHFVFNGDVVLGRSGKLPNRIWGTNIGETLTNVVWAVTARLIITSQNLMFYTMMWCLPNFISEVAPNWIIMEGIREVHSRMHTFAGIFLIAVPSLAHVLVIFVPPLIDGTELKYYPPSTFNYSTFPDHLNWTKPWDPAAVEGWTFNDHKGVHLTSDEIYRFVLMIVLFCFFFPLSRSNYANQRSYSLAMALHVFAGIWYAIDNIRKITHGLAHVTNLPILIIWCIDRLVSIYFYRRHEGHIVRKEVIGKDYVILHVKLDKEVEHTVGDVYYLLHQPKGSTGILPQRSHPFTTFANLSKDSTWDIGFVISIMEDYNQLCLPWTYWLADSTEDTAFRAWGPYRSSVSKLYNQLVSSVPSPSHYVLFATGSGCGYLLDVLSCLAHKTEPPHKGSESGEEKRIDIFYSVRCKALYHFLRKPINELLGKIKEKNVASIKFRFYLTSPEEDTSGENAVESHFQLIKGRIDFEKALKSTNKTSCCYFVGRPEIAENVEKICKKKGVRLVKDFTNGRGHQKDRHLLIKYLKMSFWAIFFTIAFCVTANIVIDVRSMKHSLQTYLNTTK